MAIVAAALAVVGPPARALIGNVVPANESEEPTETFTTANALLAIVTVDPLGGRVCVVRATVVDPGDGSLSCDDAEGWASPNFVSGAGTQIVPVAAPFLKIGNWRLLADSSGGGPDKLSFPFVVDPCIDCDTSLADSVLAVWKASAAESVRGIGNICRASEVYGRLAKPLAAVGFVRTIRAVAPVSSFSGTMVLGGVGLALAAFPSYEPQQLIHRGMEMVADLSCAAEHMYEDIVKDPPDPNFGQIAVLVGIVSPQAGDPVIDDLSASFSDVVAFGEAMRISIERYQGAVVGNDPAAQVAQLDATGRFGEELAVVMRAMARDLRNYAARADADPGENDPVIDQARLDQVVAIYQRIQASGLTASERSQLAGAGLDPAQIQAVEDSFDLDMRSTPVGLSFNAIVAAAANQIDNAASNFMVVALAAASTAATLAAAGPPPTTSTSSTSTSSTSTSSTTSSSMTMPTTTSSSTSTSLVPPSSTTSTTRPGGPPTTSLGGPVILGGDDLTQHGSVDTAGANVAGWLYMEKALKNIRVKVTRANDNSVAALGSGPSTATSGDAGAAIGRAASAAGMTVTYYNGASAIEQLFGALRAGTARPAILWISGSEGENDLLDSNGAEPQALANNATSIADFVNGGGGLLSHGVEYSWLQGLLPGAAWASSEPTGISS